MKAGNFAAVILAAAMLLPGMTGLRAEEDILFWAQKRRACGEPDRYHEFFEVFKKEKRDLNSIRADGGKSVLHLAAGVGEHQYAAVFLLKGAQVDAKDDTGRTALFYAAEQGYEWLLRMLVLAGADVNLRDGEDWTPLALAAASGKKEAVEVLLLAGAKVRPEGVPPEKQPVYAAGKKEEIVQMLDLYQGSPGPHFERFRSRVPPEGEKSLQNAAKRGDLISVSELLKSGADINALDEGGRTAVMRAIQGAQGETLFYLLLKGADVNVRASNGRSSLMFLMGWHGWDFDRMQDMICISRFKYDAVGEDGFNEIGFAASRGNIYGLRRLVEMGFDPAADTGKGTPLAIAFEAGNIETIDDLGKFGIKGELPYRSDPVWNLHQAAKLGDLGRLEEILKQGTPVDAANEAGDSALMSAIGKKQVKAARFLMSKGASIEFQNEKNGWTPLFTTLVWDFHEMTLLRQDLLKAGANPNVVSKSGQSMLMRTLGSGQGMAFRQLLAFGADPGLRDQKGRSAVEVAREAGFVETAEYLRAWKIPAAGELGRGLKL